MNPPKAIWRERVSALCNRKTAVGKASRPPAIRTDFGAIACAGGASEASKPGRRHCMPSSGVRPRKAGTRGVESRRRLRKRRSPPCRIQTRRQKRLRKQQIRFKSCRICILRSRSSTSWARCATCRFGGSQAASFEAASSSCELPKAAADRWSVCALSIPKMGQVSEPGG